MSEQTNSNPATDTNRSLMQQHPIITAVVAFFALSALAGVFFGEEVPQPSTVPSSVQAVNEEVTTVSFDQSARDRFDTLVTEVPELGSIECEGTCSSVAYFNYVSIPNDLEMMVRGNTASFSNFKMQNGTGSRVSIFARADGVTVLQCDAANGVVTSCK